MASFSVGYGIRFKAVCNMLRIIHTPYHLWTLQVGFTYRSMPKDKCWKKVPGAMMLQSRIP